jgi:hypothetical protein
MTGWQGMSRRVFVRRTAEAVGGMIITMGAAPAVATRAAGPTSTLPDDTRRVAGAVIDAVSSFPDPLLPVDFVTDPNTQFKARFGNAPESYRTLYIEALAALDHEAGGFAALGRAGRQQLLMRFCARPSERVSKAQLQAEVVSLTARDPDGTARRAAAAAAQPVPLYDPRKSSPYNDGSALIESGGPPQSTPAPIDELIRAAVTAATLPYAGDPEQIGKTIVTIGPREP